MNKVYKENRDKIINKLKELIINEATTCQKYKELYEKGVEDNLTLTEKICYLKKEIKGIHDDILKLKKINQHNNYDNLVFSPIEKN